MDPLVLVDPLTGIKSRPPEPTEVENLIELNRVTGLGYDGQGTFYITTGHGPFADEAFPGGLMSVVPGGLSRGVTGASAFVAPFDVVAVPEPAAALLVAAGASLLLFLRLARG
jgi:hypothetical protein